jgi:hypothetical protein
MRKGRPDGLQTENNARASASEADRCDLYAQGSITYLRDVESVIYDSVMEAVQGI